MTHRPPNEARYVATTVGGTRARVLRLAWLGCFLFVATASGCGRTGDHSGPDGAASDATVRDAGWDATRPDASGYDAAAHSVCGNGSVEPGEVCDDGNTVDGDGCRGDCGSDESCGNALLDPGEECDLGVLNSDAPDAACRLGCRHATCGDGIVDAARGETCDLGAANSPAPDAACRPDCRPPRCGDGIVDPAAGEVCDDGNAFDGDGCSADCRSDETCGNGIVDVVTGERCDDGNAQPGDGCHLCQASETQVNVAWEGYQNLRCVASASNGSSVVIWQSYHSPTSTDETLAQRFHADGSRAGGPYVLSGHPSALDCALRDSGALIVLEWEQGIRVRRYSAAGAFGGTALSPPGLSQFDALNSSLVMRSDGRAAVAWRLSPGSPGGEGIRVQRFNDQGLVDASPIEVASSGTDRPGVGVADDDRFLVTWVGDSAGLPAVHARWFDSDGAPEAPATQVNTTPIAFPGASEIWVTSAVAVAPSGSAVVAWSVVTSGPESGEVLAQRIAPDGTLSGAEIGVNTFTSGEQVFFSVAMVAAGRFAISWSSFGEDGSDWGVYHRRFDALGVPLGPAIGSSSYTHDDQRSPWVVALPAGYLFAWQSEGQDGDRSGVFALHVDEDGLALPLGP